jgi:hypothetical protein
MTQKPIRSLAIFCLMALLASCGGGSTLVNVVPPPPGTSAAASLSLRDAPPANVTVLSFELTVSGAVLQPGNVSLLSNPIRVEVKQLEVESALLNTSNVAAGMYTSIDVMVSNPELTIQNNSGAMIGTCADKAICELKPPLSSAKVTVNFNPALTITAGKAVDLLLDLNLANSISMDLASISPSFTITQLAAVEGAGVAGKVEDLEDVVGTVQSKDTANNSFTLQSDPAIPPLTIKVDNDTRFRDFDEVNCATENFACLATGQMVEVNATLLGGGMILAKKVSIENEEQNAEDLRGVIAAIASPTQFQIVVLDEKPIINNLTVGNKLTVNLVLNTKFSIQKGDSDGVDIMGLNFAAASDLLVGQFVQIKPAGPVSGMPPAVDTDRVRLKNSSLTATVKAAPSGTDFTLNNLPALFTMAGIMEIDVRASASAFEEGESPLAGISALKAGDMVSVRGLLFKNMAANPILVATKVRKRLA